MTIAKVLSRLVLTAVLGAGALTSMAWGETDVPRYVKVRDEGRDHRRDEARERRAREQRREREERREREQREHHWHDYGRR